MAGSHSSQMAKARVQKAFMYGLLAACAAAGVAVVLVGLYAKFPTHNGGPGGVWEDPNLTYVKTPNLLEIRKAFTPDLCYDSYDLQWKSGADGQIYVNGNPFFMKGMSWFGCEGRGFTFTGLNYTSMDTILNWMAHNKYNVIRMPVSVTFALSDPATTFPERAFVSKDLQKKTIWDILEIAIDQAALRGQLVMIDMHNLEPQKPTELWYNENVSEADMFRAWENIMARYGKKWNVFALDLKNEPHGVATWGNAHPATDFNKFYERLITHLNNKFPEFRGLYLVEGVQFNAETDLPTDYPFWWGGNFGGAKEHPITVDSADVMDRIVYSPHIYGPDVYDHAYFKSPKLKETLKEVWDSQLGWLAPTLKKGVIIGEWGGNLIGKDDVVQRELVKYLIDSCIANNVWWALNPESGDTGGVMAWNWKTFDKKKVDLTTSVFNDPSAMGISKGKLCFYQGTYPNPRCAMQNIQGKTGSPATPAVMAAPAAPAAPVAPVAALPAAPAAPAVVVVPAAPAAPVAALDPADPAAPLAPPAAAADPAAPAVAKASKKEVEVEAHPTH